MALTLKLGDVLNVTGVDFVVGSVTATAANEVYAVQLFSVPAGKLPGDLGKTWQRGDDGVEEIFLSTPTALSKTVNLEPPPAPLPETPLPE